MSNSFFTLGLLSLFALVLVYLFSLFYPESEFLNILKEKRSINKFLFFALFCFCAGLILRILYPIKKIFKNRCKRCNAEIPENDIYCLTCLRELRDRRY